MEKTGPLPCTGYNLDSGKYSPRTPADNENRLGCLFFSGQNEGTISVTEGETLFVIEEDKGDGWTRIRRNEDEEGYVPTSYVEVFLEKNAKGAMTYI